MSVIERIADGARHWSDIIEDRPLLVSVSGGKDSTAMALWLIEQGLQDRCRFVFCDTGWEHPEVYKYIDEVLEPKIGKIHRLTSEKFPNGMTDLVMHKGWFPTRQRRFCTKYLKINPLKKYLKDWRAEGADPISVVGIRANESKRRSKFEEWDDGGPMNCDTWRPLISWLVKDVIDMHTKHSVVPCSLYLRDKHPSVRVGCYPCIMSRKDEIRAVAANDPWRIDQIRQLEKDVTEVCKQKVEAKGETMESRGYHEGPRFFQARVAEKGNEDLSQPWPIDKVVEWANTSRGGRQFEMFHTSEPGCQMWGLCDMGPNDDNAE